MSISLMVYFIGFGAYDGTWDRTAAASVAGLSSLGLLRDRMMKRQQKEEEAWMQQDDKRNQQMREMEERSMRRNTRNVLSTAAGLGTFAAVGTTNLPPLSPDKGYEMVNQASRASSFASTGSGQNPLVGGSRISQVGFGGGIANAATTTLNDYAGGRNVAAHWNPEMHNEQYNQMPGDTAATSSSSIIASAYAISGVDTSALDSSTSILASEFSRGTSGIYDSLSYTKRRPSYTGIDSGFSPPLKESAPRRKSRLVGGITMRKSKFDSTFVKEKPSESDRGVGQSNVPKAVTLPRKSVPTIPSPPKTQSAQVSSAVTKAVVTQSKAPVSPKTQPAPVPVNDADIAQPKAPIPEKIPLDVSSQPIVKPQSTAIPEKIPLTPDIIPESRKSPPPQPIAEPKVVPERVDPSRTLNAPDTDGKEDTSATHYPVDVSRMPSTFRIKNQKNGFYAGIAAGTFGAIVAKAFQGGAKESKEGESPSQERDLDSLSQTGGLPPDNIYTDQPFTFQSSSAETTSQRESNFAIQTPTTTASSTTTQAASGETRVRVAVETTLEKGSSVGFSAGTDFAGGVSFSEVPGNKQANYGDAIDVPSSHETPDYKTSYLDSLRRGSPGSAPGAGLQSYLEELSPLSFSAPPMEYSMNQVGTSLDNISEDLDAMSNDLDSITPDITSALGSISNDLTSVSEDITSASKALSSSLPSQQYFGSYLDNLSQGAPTCSGQGLTSYLNDLSGAVPVCSDQGLTSYLDDLSSTTPSAFDLPTLKALPLNPPDAVESFEVEAPAAYSYEQADAGDFTQKQGSYLESISQITSALGSGRGLTSYLSDLSSAAPLVFDLPAQESFDSPPPTESMQSPSVTSYTAPVPDPTNTGRPRRVRVFVEHSVDVQKI